MKNDRVVGRLGEWMLQSDLGTQITIPQSNTKEFLLEYFRDAVSVGKATVVVWTADGSDPSGWGGLMLW